VLRPDEGFAPYALVLCAFVYSGLTVSSLGKRGMVIKLLAGSAPACARVAAVGQHCIPALSYPGESTGLPCSFDGLGRPAWPVRLPFRWRRAGLHPDR